MANRTVRPIDVHVMIHLYYLSTPFAPQGPAYHDAIRMFISLGFIETHDAFPSGYHVTYRGEKYVERLCNTAIQGDHGG